MSKNIMRARLNRDYDVDLAPFFPGDVFYPAVGRREQRIVFTDAHVIARVKTSTALADYYGAGGNELAAERLQAEALAGAIAPVSG